MSPYYNINIWLCRNSIMLNSKLSFILVLIFFFGLMATLYQMQLAKFHEKILLLELQQEKYGVFEYREEGNGLFDEEEVIILYNRVPKTASTSFVGVAYDLCKRNKFHVLHVNITANSHILSLENQLKFVANVSKWITMRPAIYHGHFAFLDFSKYGSFKPLYINVIRKPLDRFISYYYFVRYGDNYRPYLIRRKHGNTMSFDDCVIRQLPDCDPSNMWLQIPFFCGHSTNCWKPGSKWALNEAKRNLLNKYFLVGVTEELDDFIFVLEQSLPRIFKGASEHYLNSNKSHLRQTVQKDLPSDDTIRKIKESPIWQMENELYEFALEHFHFVKNFNLRNRLQNVIYEKIRPKN